MSKLEIKKKKNTRKEENKIYTCSRKAAHFRSQCRNKEFVNAPLYFAKVTNQEARSNCMFVVLDILSLGDKSWESVTRMSDERHNEIKYFIIYYLTMSLG